MHATESVKLNNSNSLFLRMDTSLLSRFLRYPWCIGKRVSWIHLDSQECCKSARQHQSNKFCSLSDTSFPVLMEILRLNCTGLQTEGNKHDLAKFGFWKFSCAVAASEVHNNYVYPTNAARVEVFFSFFYNFLRTSAARDIYSQIANRIFMPCNISNDAVWWAEVLFQYILTKNCNDFDYFSNRYKICHLVRPAQ